jgi:hypothetical protein
MDEQRYVTTPFFGCVSIDRGWQQNVTRDMDMGLIGRAQMWDWLKRTLLPQCKKRARRCYAIATYLSHSRSQAGCQKLNRQRRHSGDPFRTDNRMLLHKQYR